MSFARIACAVVSINLLALAWRSYGQAQPAALPEFLKAGTRLAFEEGQSTVYGASSHLVPSKDGNGWVDNQGKKWDIKENMNSGGVGYLALDIVYATPQLIAADGRSVMLVDQQNKLTQSVGPAALTGNSEKLGQYWINPATLAQMADHRGDGELVNRVNYSANGKDYNAISILNASASSYENLIYDLDTGILLSASRSNQGAPVAVHAGAGNIGQGAGATNISHTRFIGVRELKLPWANEPPPPWAAAGRSLVFQGGYSAILRGGEGLPPLPPYPMSVTFSFDQAVEGCLLGKMLTRSSVGQGLPAQETTADRCITSAMLTPLWISPRVLAQLQPNQVIDDDSLTRLRLTYAGAQGNVGVFVEQGPLETNQYIYDMQGGTLVAIRALRAQGPNQMQIELQLAQQ